MDKSRNPSVREDGPVIIRHLSDALKEFSCLSNIDIAYGTPVADTPLPLDVIVDTLFTVGVDISFEKPYNAFHEKLHEELNRIMPEHAGCWYVHEVITFRLSSGKDIRAGLVETFCHPEKNIVRVEARNLIDDLL